MKKYILVLSLLVSMIATAQNAELYDVMSMFAPDSVTGKPLYPMVKSKKAKPLNISLNGKLAPHDELLMIEKVAWIFLADNDLSYEIQATGYELPKKNPLASLFGTRKYKSKLIKQCVNKTAEKNWIDFYEITFPGKKSVWIKINADAMYGPYMPILTITCYQKEKDMDKTCVMSGIQE